mgnify:CR=1 FL=1
MYFIDIMETPSAKRDPEHTLQNKNIVIYKNIEYRNICKSS